jgi:hypothetical protein
VLLLIGSDYELLDRQLGKAGTLSDELLREAWAEVGDQILEWHHNGYADGVVVPGFAGAGPQPGEPWGARYKSI